MLIICPECELQVSDKAITCPHCGYPLNPAAANRTRKKMNKRRRLPNGFGQITEIKGKSLRKPFRAMVTIGKDMNGRPMCKILKPHGYFETYNEAYAALVEYNKDPYELTSTMTMSQLFDEWLEMYTKNKSASTIRNLKCAWQYANTIHDYRVGDIHCRQLKPIFETGHIETEKGIVNISPSTKLTLKSLLNNMFDYAVECEYTDKNYARLLTSIGDARKEKEANRKEHMPYSDEEIQKLWDHLYEYDCIDVMLIQCYSGWRPLELCQMKLEHVNIKDWVFEGGVKTAAGKDRIVPIHSKIQPLVKHRYEEAKRLHSDLLFNVQTQYSGRCGTGLTYNRYLMGMMDICTALGLRMDHRPHDGRNHFVTQAKKAEMNDYAIKYIVGHQIRDLTERVYTTRTIDWLRSEIEKIP